MEIYHPSNPNLLFDCEYRPEEKKTGESGYSLGSPQIPAYYEITAVAWKGVDITDFLTEYCDKLFQTWEEEINQ